MPRLLYSLGNGFCPNRFMGILKDDPFVRGKWKPTRIEYGDNWYLVGIRAEDLNGLRVRI